MAIFWPLLYANWSMELYSLRFPVNETTGIWYNSFASSATCLTSWLLKEVFFSSHYFSPTSLMIDTELNSVTPIRSPLHRYYSDMSLEVHLHNDFIVRTVLNLTYSLLSLSSHIHLHNDCLISSAQPKRF